MPVFWNLKQSSIYFQPTNMPHLPPEWKQSSVAYVSLSIQRTYPQMGVSTNNLLGKKHIRKRNRNGAKGHLPATQAKPDPSENRGK